jgi:hypothetical protein
MSKAKRKRSAAPLPASLADRGPPERSRHDALLDRATGIPGVVGKRIQHACRLDWYWDKYSRKTSNTAVSGAHFAVVCRRRLQRVHPTTLKGMTLWAPLSIAAHFLNALMAYVRDRAA